MKPAPFEYYRPQSTDEALSLLSNFDGYAAVLSGGQTLMPLLNLRLAQPDRVVDVSRIKSMADWSENPHAVVLGASCTHAGLEDTRFPDPSHGLLSTVAGGIAYRSIRNRGTLGGSLAYADPAAEWPAVMMALKANVEILGLDGSRTLPVSDFITGSMSTDLTAEELLVAVSVPKLPAHAKWGFRKLARKPGDFAQALTIAIIGEDTRIVMGALPQGPLSLCGVAQYVATLDSFTEHQPRDFLDAFSLDLANAGITLDPYEEQIHRHILASVLQDIFKQ